MNEKREKKKVRHRFLLPLSIGAKLLQHQSLTTIVITLRVIFFFGIEKDSFLICSEWSDEWCCNRIQSGS